MNPSLRGYIRPVRISLAFVPASIRSSLVRTPMVRRPWGSTDRASFSDSELARSTFAAETESMTLKAGKKPVRTVVERNLMRTRTNSVWICSLERGFVFGVRCRLVGLRPESKHKVQRTVLVNEKSTIPVSQAEHPPWLARVNPPTLNPRHWGCIFAD